MSETENTDPRDPGNFLSRIPALAELMGDAEIAAAIQKPDPFDVYAALRKRLKSLHDHGRRQQLEAVLAHRVLFARPINSAPAMFTLNGVGTRLYGSEDAGLGDGSYIGTLWFTFVFLPVFPLSQYWVRDAGGNKYSFLAKVPGAPWTNAWRTVVSLAVLVAILGSVAGYAKEGQEATIHLANGLDIPVKVSLGKTEVVVEPRGRVTQRVRTGKLHLAAHTDDARLLEELDVEVPGHTDVVAYNVLGAAAFYAEGIFYGDKAKAPRTNPSKGYAGTRWVVRDDVPYVFTEPPDSIQTEYGETRWLFGLHPGGWRSAATMLAYEGKPDQAAELCHAVAATEPDNTAAHQYELHYLRRSGKLDEALQASEGWRRAVPESLDAHLAYQELMLALDRQDELRRVFAAEAKDAADPARAAFLAARVEPLALGAPHFLELVKQYPGEPQLRWGAAETLFRARQFAAALAQVEAMDGENGRVLSTAALSVQARVLVAQGKANEALRRLDAYLEDEEPSLAFAVLYGRLARLARPAHDVKELVVGLDHSRGPPPELWYALMVEDAPVPPAKIDALDDEEMRAALHLLRALPAGGDDLLTLVAKTPRGGLELLDDAVLLLLTGEAIRVGQPAVVKRLMEAIPSLGPAHAKALEAYVKRGEESELLRRFDLEEQAALQLARARAVEAEGKDGSALYAAVLRDDLLPGLITRATKGWPHPKAP